MQETIGKNGVRAYGPTPIVAYARWAPSNAATQTLTDAFGITSITRSAAGLYTVNLSEAHKGLCPMVQAIDDGTTHYHFVRATASSASSKTISVQLRSVAFASVATGPANTDTCDELVLIVMCRGTN